MKKKSKNKDEFKSDFDEEEGEVINFDDKIVGEEIPSFDFGGSFEKNTDTGTEMS